MSKATAAFPCYWQKCSAENDVAAQACFCIKVEKKKNRAVQTKHIDPAKKDPQSL